MMAHSCQIGDDSDGDGESNSYLAENGKGWMTSSLFCPQTTMATKSSPARLGDHHLGAVGVELSPQVLMLQGHLGEEEIRNKRKSGEIETLKMSICRFAILLSDAHESSVIVSRLKDPIHYAAIPQ